MPRFAVITKCRRWEAVERSYLIILVTALLFKGVFGLQEIDKVKDLTAFPVFI